MARTARLGYSSLTKEQFDKEIEKGMSDVKAGRVYSAEVVKRLKCKYIFPLAFSI